MIQISRIIMEMKKNLKALVTSASPFLSSRKVDLLMRLMRDDASHDLFLFQLATDSRKWASDSRKNPHKEE